MNESEGDPVPAVIPPGRIGDRFVGAFVTVTLVLFVVTIGLLIFLVTRVASVENANRANATASCQQSNVNRLEDIAIWNRLLNVSPAAAADRKEVAELKHLVAVKDTPRNCG